MFYTTSNIALDTGNSITWLILPTPLTHSLGITLQGPSIPKKYSYYTSLFKTILTLIFPPILRTPIIGNQLPSGQNSDFVLAEIPSFIILFLILIIFLCAVIYRKFLNCYPQRSLSIILTSKRISAYCEVKWSRVWEHRSRFPQILYVWEQFWQSICSKRRMKAGNKGTSQVYGWGQWGHGP